MFLKSLVICIFYLHFDINFALMRAFATDQLRDDAQILEEEAAATM
jgi:hypothetical protein